MMDLQGGGGNPMHRSEIDHRFEEAEAISREYPFSPEDVFYAYRYFRWDLENTEAILILALTHGVSPFQMIRLLNAINTSEDGTGETERRKKHIRVQKMKLKGLSGHNRAGFLFEFSYQYHFKVHSFNVFISQDNARNLCRKLFDMDLKDVAGDPHRWESFLIAIMKEVLTVFGRYPMERILTLDRFEVTGGDIRDVRGMEWEYDGRNEIELTRPGKFSIRI